MNPTKRHRILARWGLALVTLGVFVAALLSFGGHILVVADPLPEGAHAIVVLRGSSTESEVRLEAGARFVEEHVADRLLLSVRRGTIWGEPVPEMARAYMERRFPLEAVQRFTLCPNAADSTGEEALALLECLMERGWTRVVVVTSEYHTRRTRLIWRAVAERADVPLEVAVRGVPDGNYDPRNWWRERRYAKSWVLEMQKLVWYFIEGLPDPQPDGVEY